MTPILADIRERFHRGDICIQLIYINIGMFIVVSLIRIVAMLFNLDIGFVLKYFELPASFPHFFMQPWSIVSYMFMHADIWHILFNMLWLWWFGGLFLQFFSAKHLRGLYVLGGLCGGLLYMVSFNLFPYFSQVIKISYLLGASASVLAIVTATAIKAPDFQVRFLFIGNVSLKYIALFMIFFDLLFILSDNAGGHLAHLGGAAAGVWFALGLNKGHDATKWINKAIDCFFNLFEPSSKKPKMKAHYGGKQQEYDYNTQKKKNSEEIDRILDKLKQSGYGSLTADEKKSLFDASKK